MTAITDADQIKKLGEFEDPLTFFPTLGAAVGKLISQVRSQEKNAPKSAVFRKAAEFRKQATTTTELDHSGGRLVELSGFREGAKLVQRLLATPRNSEARLILVKHALKHPETDNPLIFRDALALCFLEIELGVLNADNLRLAQLIQRRYLGSLILALEDIVSHEAAASGEGSTQRKGIWYLKAIAKNIKLRSLDSDFVIDLPSVLETGRLRRDDVVRKFGGLAEVLGNLPLAKHCHERMHGILEKVHKQLPIAGCHRSILLRKNVRLQMVAFTAGQRELESQISEQMETAMSLLKQSLKLLGHTGTRQELAVCVREFGLLTQTFHQYMPRLGHQLTRSHTSNLEMAIGLLRKIAGERGIPELHQKLVKSLDELKVLGEVADEKKSDEEKTSPLDEEPVNKFFDKEVPEDQSFRSDHDESGNKRPSFFEKQLPKDL